jgi:putative transposase
MKAVALLSQHQDKLLTFCDCRAEHWKHLLTANPMELSLATVRLRQQETKGPQP